MEKKLEKKHRTYAHIMKKLAKVSASSSERADEIGRRVSTEKSMKGKRRGKAGAILDS